MKKEIGKKLLIIMLTLALVITMMPIVPGAVQTAQAAEENKVVVNTYDELVSELVGSGHYTIVLGNSIEVEGLKGTFLLDDSKILDLNGNSIFFRSENNCWKDDETAPSEKNLFTIDSGDTLVVKDSAGGGNIIYTAKIVHVGNFPFAGIGPGPMKYEHYAVRDMFHVYGKLVVEDGIFQAGEAHKQYMHNAAKNVHQIVCGTAIKVFDGGEAIVNGGEFRGFSVNELAGEGSAAVLDVSDGGRLVINDGFFLQRGMGPVVRGIPEIYGGTFQSRKFDNIRITNPDMIYQGDWKSGKNVGYNIPTESWYHEGAAKVWIDGKEQADISTLNFVSYKEEKPIKFKTSALTGSISYTSGAFAGKSISFAYGGLLKDLDYYANYRLKYQWQVYDESSETWDDISNATTADYVIGKSYLDKQIRVKITADGYAGYVLSQPITVSKQYNYEEPYYPALSVSYANKQITVKSYSAYKSTQEYVITTSSEKPTEDQWADSSLKPNSSGIFTNLTGGKTYYVHTRFKETDTAYAGKVVYSTRGDMKETVPLTGIELKTGSDTGRYVQAGEYVSVDVVPVPYNATNFGDGVLGKNWYTNDNAKIYANSKGADLDPDEYYDRVYVKADSKETVTVSATQTIGYNNIAKGDITFDFCDSNGQYSFKKTQTSFAPDTVTVGRGSTATTRIYSDLTPDKPIHVVTFAHASYTDLSGVTIERIGDSNEILITASEDATIGKGGYRPTVNGDAMTNCLYINVVEENIPVDLVEINTMAKKIKSGETCTLSATVTPGNATDNKVTWTSSDSSIAKVDGNGVVTGVKDGTVTITAKAGDKTATCKIVVDNALNTHLVYVYNGTASKDSAKAGETITITADEGEGATFNGWMTEDVTLASTTAKSTSFTMPDHEVSITAVYKECEHNWNSGTITTQPTCKAEGVKTYKCTVCGATKTEAVAKLTNHSYDSGTITTQPTCKAAGVKTYKCTVCGTTKTESVAKLTTHTYGSDNKCTVCGAVKPGTGEGGGTTPTPEPEHQHSYAEKLTPATTTKNGSIKSVCTACGDVASSKTIYKASGVKLSYSTKVYTGKMMSPKVYVKDSKGNTISSKYYTISKPSGRKNTGKYTYTIKFKGNYSGKKTLTLTINPKAPTLTTPKAASKAVTVKWKKGLKSQVTGYEVRVATNSKFTKNVKKATVTKYSTVSKKMTKLKAKTKYYVQVRAYKTVKVNGKNVKLYSAWSGYKTCKTR